MNPLTKYGLIALAILALAGGVGSYVGYLKNEAKDAQISLANQKVADANSAAEAARLALVSAQLFNRQQEDARLLADADRAAKEKQYEDQIAKLRAAKGSNAGSALSPAARAYYDSLR